MDSSWAQGHYKKVKGRRPVQAPDSPWLSQQNVCYWNCQWLATERTERKKERLRQKGTPVCVK